MLSFCQSVFEINFDTTSVTTALKSELNALRRSLFITTQMEREYFPFERSCQTCPVLCLLSEAPWSLFRRKGDEGKKGQKQSGREEPSKTIDQKFRKKVQGQFQLETAALCGHRAAFGPPLWHLGAVSILQRVKLLYFVGQWFYLQWQGATQTASVYMLGKVKSYSVPRGCSNPLGLYSAGIGRVGVASIQIHKRFEDT